VSRRLGTWLVLGGAVLVIAVAVVLVVTSGSRSKAGLTAREQHGRQLFIHTCQNCHMLRATRAVGMVGPNLDNWAPWGLPPGVVAGAIEEGRASAYRHMPAGLLTRSEARSVAAFVSRVTHEDAVRRGGPPPLDWQSRPGG
jgi:mono/diheme cytochrome c family protein